MDGKSVATRQKITLWLRFARIKGQFAWRDLVSQAPALDHAGFAHAGQHKK